MNFSLDEHWSIGENHLLGLRLKLKESSKDEETMFSLGGGFRMN